MRKFWSFLSVFFILSVVTQNVMAEDATAVVPICKMFVSEPSGLDSSNSANSARSPNSVKGWINGTYWICANTNNVPYSSVCAKDVKVLGYDDEGKSHLYRCNQNTTSNTFEWVVADSDLRKCDGSDFSFAERTNMSDEDKSLTTFGYKLNDKLIEAIDITIAPEAPDYLTVVNGKINKFNSDYGNDIRSNGTYCANIRCKTGYKKSTDGTKCVPKAEACRETGGEWKNNACDCKSAPFLESNGDNACKCKDNYDYIDNNNKSLGCESLVDKCKNSGGDWTGTACSCDGGKKLTSSLDGKACECEGGYDYINNDNKAEGCGTLEDKCEASGGEWTGDACDCTSAPFLKSNGDNACVCEDNYDYIKNDDKAQGCESLELKCTGSGGTWESNACTCEDSKHLELNGNACECESAEYEYKDPNNKSEGCKITDEGRCKLSGGDWRDTECKCNSNKYLKPKSDNKECECVSEYYDYKDNKSEGCEMTPDGPKRKKCDEAAGTAGKPKWSPSDRKCVCENTDGKSYTWNDKSAKCVETDDSIIERCKGPINTASAALEKILDGMKLPKSEDRDEWKNAEGKFNVARLISDSVAGVVLGTVGGVVTSSVVKKHQVKDGFEDLKCYIGGQAVAGWGDEFNVGIQ